MRKHFSHNKKIGSTVLIATVFLGVWAATATADDITLNIKGDTPEEKLKHISKEKKKTKQTIKLKEKQKSIINKQLENIVKEEKNLEQKIRENRKQLEETSEKVKRLAQIIAEQERTIAAQRKILAGLLRSQYEQVGNNNLSARLFTARDGTVELDKLARINKKTQETLERIRKLREKTRLDHDKLKEAQKKLTDTEEKLRQRDSYLESTRNYKRYLINKTKREINKFTEKLSKLEEKERELQREIERIESGKLDNLNYGNLPSRAKADMTLPVKKYWLSQSYGKATFRNKYYSFHNGWDMAYRGDGDIRAAGEGKVIARGDNGRNAYGRWLAVDHQNGLVTMYAHLKSFKVKVGDKVKKGEKIAVMGNTGFSTGRHLHFTIYAANTFEVVKRSGLRLPTGASVNPSRYLSPR